MTMTTGRRRSRISLSVITDIMPYLSKDAQRRNRRHLGVSTCASRWVGDAAHDSSVSRSMTCVGATRDGNSDPDLLIDVFRLRSKWSADFDDI